MAIPANFEGRINDPISLEPYKDVQLTNCKHRYSLSSALEIFGEMKGGQCTKQVLCPLCKQAVKKYEPDPLFQDLVDEILKSSQEIKPQATFQQPVPLMNSSCSTATTSSTHVEMPFSNKTQDNSDEVIARALQEQLDREAVSAKRTHELSPSSTTAVNQRVITERRVVNLGNSEYFYPQDNTENCEINGSENSKIMIGNNSFDIVITGGISNTINIGSQCSNIRIKSGRNNELIVGNLCTNMTLDLGMNSYAKIGNNCSNLRIFLGLSANYKLGKKCTNIFVNGAQVA